MYVCAYECTYIQMNAYMYICTCKYVYVLCMYVDVCMYVCMYVCMHVSVVLV